MRKTETDYRIGPVDWKEYPGSFIRPADSMILYCESGRAIVTVNFERRLFRGGDIAVLFSDTLFAVTDAGRDFRLWHIDLSPAFADETTFQLSSAFFDRVYDDPIFPTSEGLRELFKAWRRLNTYFMRFPAGPAVRTLMRNQVQNFFMALEAEALSAASNRKAGPVGTARQILIRFCRLIEEHCHSRHEVKFYADKLCVTPYYLSRITFRTVGLSPKKMIDRQIVTEMKRLLITTDLSAKEIADRFDFESTSYMGRYFRRHTGMTPTEFRERQ